MNERLDEKTDYKNNRDRRLQWPVSDYTVAPLFSSTVENSE